MEKHMLFLSFTGFDPNLTLPAVNCRSAKGLFVLMLAAPDNADSLNAVYGIIVARPRLTPA